MLALRAQPKKLIKVTEIKIQSRKNRGHHNYHPLNAEVPQGRPCAPIFCKLILPAILHCLNTNI